MDCKKIIDNYIKWIKDNTSIKMVEEGLSCEITTPFLDRHNDHLQIYVIKKGSEYILTDDGYTISDLAMSGMDMKNSEKRQKILKTLLNGFGVSIGENDDLYTKANFTNIGQKKHYLLQAVLAVNDMHVLSRENVYSLFKEEVEKYFKANEIFYSKDIKITGKTGFDHNIDFIIPASKNKQERLIKTINNPIKDPIMAAIFAFNDISEVREAKVSNYIIYNDEQKEMSDEISAALKNYGIVRISWRNRERAKEEFAFNAPSENYSAK